MRPIVLKRYNLCVLNICAMQVNSFWSKRYITSERQTQYFVYNELIAMCKESQSTGEI